MTVEISVEEVMQDYEAEIGRLNGIIIRNKATYRVELQQREAEIQNLLEQLQQIRTAQEKTQPS